MVLLEFHKPKKSISKSDKYFRNNWSDYISVYPNKFNYSKTGDISNLQIIATNITKYKIDSLEFILCYETGDERENRQTKHSIKIDGNLRTGSATLKQAVNLYMKFKKDIQENQNTI